MTSELKPPIFLFGNTRSGTTILHRILGSHPDLVPWYEPRNIWQYADPRRGHDEFDETDATDKVVKYIRGRFLKYQTQNDNRRVIEKTPVNVLKIRFVHAIFPESKYLYIVRNPFSVISSMELKWQKPVSKVSGVKRRLKTTPLSQVHHYVRPLLEQQFRKRVLKEKYLTAWGPRYRGMSDDLEELDILTVIARQWAQCSRQAASALTAIDETALHQLRYEDFVHDPMGELDRIVEHLGIDLTPEMARLAQGVDPERQEKWQRFDPQSLLGVLPELKDEMDRHGYEIPYELAQLAKGGRN